MNNKIKHIVLTYLNDNYSSLTPLDGYSSKYLFMKGSVPVFLYEPNNNTTYFSFFTFWKDLETLFGLTFEDIQDITKQWVSDCYNIYCKDVDVSDLDLHLDLFLNDAIF